MVIIYESIPVLGPFTFTNNPEMRPIPQIYRTLNCQTNLNIDAISKILISKRQYQEDTNEIM